jgi:general secretion pathway protein N
MRARSWWALGAGAYVAFAIVSMPAGTAYRWLAPEAIRLAGLQGTVWSGRAASGVLAGAAVHDLRWDIEPWALCLGRLAATLELRFADGFASSRVTATLRTIELNDLRASMSLTSLAGVLPSAAAGAQGLASLTFASIEIDHQGWPMDADGELRLSQLTVPPLIPMGTNKLVPLGEYRLAFTPTAGEGLSATVSDTGGPLEVSGSLHLGADRRYQLVGYARPRPDADPMLVQGLQLMGGDADSSGKREFSLSGSL